MAGGPKLEINLSNAEGFWIEGDGGNRYTKTNNAVAGDTITACYAINLNTLLADFEEGEYSFTADRSVKNSAGLNIQYTPYDFSGKKLNPIEENS